MSVTEIKQAIGRWDLRLNEETPVTLLDKLTYFGHIALLPGRVDVAQYGDNLLSAARYVGVLRGRDQQNTFKLKGSGMSFWLGDEDGKGDILETLLTFSGTTFANTIRGLLPPSGAITEGTFYSVPGTYAGKHQWVTPREAITYVSDLFGAEFRVNHNGTLDAGLISDLYVTVPKTLILPKGFGSDLFRKVISGEQSMGIDVEDTTTRVVLLAEGEGTNIATAAANAPATSYKDIHGNAVKMTRLVSESSTAEGNAAARAQLQLNRFLNPRRAVDLSTSEYDVKGTFVVGDYLDVYDPVNSFYDANREIYWQGERINPMALRCVEMTWPIPAEWTVAFRDVNGVWYDLSDYYVPEDGDTTIVVGELARGLSSVGGEPVGVRPNLPDADTPSSDTTIPGVPVFTGFSTGIYETLDRSLAAVQANWSQPLNVDGSTITDGDHYEIRYRPNAIIGAPVPWDILSGGYAVDFEDPFDINYTGGFGPNWTVGTDLSTSGGLAIIAHPTFNVVRITVVNGQTYENVEILASHEISYMPTGASTVMGVYARRIDASNRYWIRVEPNTDGSVTAKITRLKAGVSKELAVRKIPGMVHTPGVRYWQKVTVYGDTISTKVWQGDIADEPAEDILSAWDQDPIVGSGQFGLADWIVTGATNPAGSQTKHSHFRARNLAPDNVANAYSWDELGTWDAPTSEPVAVTPNWSIAYAGWDQTTYTIAELGAGIKYEFQIRAVDSASPPHQGAWSTSSYVDTSGDVIAPSTPAAPLVAASMIAVQIEHRLGKATGGAFNLEQDLAKLEVYASHTPTFVPSSANKVGDLIATGPMVRSGIPAVGTFKVDQPGSVWIRVVAVDRMGNSSGPSEAVQSSVDLIDDAHITSLTVSKLTAGTITAQTVLAAEMEVGAGGNIKLTDGSLDVYDSQNQLRVEVGAQPDGSYDLAAVEPDTGARVNLAQLAFGTQGKKMGPTLDLPGGNTSVFTISDMTITIDIGSSGRAMVHHSMAASIPQGAWVNMWCEVYDSSNVYVTGTIGLIVADTKVITDANWTGNVVGSSGTTDLITGLSAGTYTFRTKVNQTTAHATFASHVDQAQIVIVPF